MTGLAQDAGTGEPRRLARLMVLLLGCVTLVIIAAIVPLSVMAHQNPLASAGTGLALGIPFGAVGVVVMRRQPRNSPHMTLVTKTSEGCRSLQAGEEFGAPRSGAA